MSDSSIQYGQVPFNYMNRLRISYATNTVLLIQPGSTIDSTSTYQLDTSSSDSAIFIDSSVVGAGGLDAGPVLPNKVYGVFVIWDPVGSNPPAGMLSSSYFHPLYPFGYGAIKLIGFVTTDASANFRPGDWSADNSGYRSMTYAPNVNVLLNGTAAVQTVVNLISCIPNLGGVANCELSFVSTTPGNALTIYSRGTNFNLYSQAAGVPNTVLNSYILTSTILLDGVVSPTIGYSVTNAATDSASISVNGYNFSV